MTTVNFTVPLHQSYSSNEKNTCVTRTPNCGGLTSRYTNDIILGYASPDPFTGGVPLYSSFSGSREDTCITTGPACNGQAILYELNLPPVIGYVANPNLKFTGSTPLYSSYSSTREDTCLDKAPACGGKVSIGAGAYNNDKALPIGYAALTAGPKTIGTPPDKKPPPDNKSFWSKYWPWFVIGGAVLLAIIIIIIIVVIA